MTPNSNCTLYCRDYQIESPIVIRYEVTMNIFTSTLLILLLPSLGWSAPASPDEQDLFDPAGCMGFFALNFTILNFDRYPVYFDDDSVLTVAQTGEYKGAEDILEYVLFVDASIGRRRRLCGW